MLNLNEYLRVQEFYRTALGEGWRGFYEVNDIWGLVYEEFMELNWVIHRIREAEREGTDWSEELRGELIKELADLLYVVLGAAAYFRIPIVEAFHRVHESNMSKLMDEPLMVDGKIQKSSSYIPPELSDL